LKNLIEVPHRISYCMFYWVGSMKKVW
jgi:hypothetical protein